MTDDEQSLGTMDGTRAYFAQIGGLSRLTVEEEVHYARQYSDARHQLLHDLCRFPAVAAQILRRISGSQRMSELAEYLHVREFEDLSALKEQLMVSVHQVEDLAAEYAEQMDRHEGPPEHWCSQARERLHQMLKQLPLRDAFCELCVQALPPPEAAPETAGEYALICRRIEAALSQQNLARTAMVEGNLRLVVSIARKYVNCGLPFMDLVQEGNIGLVRAVENFDADRGHRFSTYASYWIKRGIMKALTEQSRIIRLPANMVATLRQISKAREDTLQDLGYEPSAEEIAERVDMAPARVRALSKMSQQMISLQSTVDGDSGGRELAERLQDENAEPPEKRVADTILKEALLNAIETLSERERRILVLHYGLDGQEACTLDQIAAEYTLTGERIRQIEHAALKKLRDPSRRQILDVDGG